MYTFIYPESAGVAEHYHALQTSTLAMIDMNDIANNTLININIIELVLKFLMP